jgi:hypothetical protein
LDETDSRAVTRWSRNIERRTGLYAFFNRRHRLVHFCMRSDDCSVAPVAPQVGFRSGLRLPSEDDTCREIRECRMTAAEKDRMIRERERDGAREANNEVQQILEDAKPEMRDDAKRLTGERKVVSMT